MIAYFAHPIDLFDPEDKHKTAIRQIQLALRSKGIGIFTPGNAWLLPTSIDGDTATEVFLFNNNIVEQTDLLVAYLPQDSASIGVPLEIQYAFEHDRPVLLVGSGRVSLIVTALREINDGFVVQMDSEHRNFNTALPDAVDTVKAKVEQGRLDV